MVKYSICMTCFNEAETTRDSLDSVLSQLGSDFEVIVVDNFSTDGTYRVLREFEQTHKIKLIRRRSSRGLGRQIAFENASGEYILANLDLDDVFLPVLEEVVSLYHEKAEGNLLAIFNSSAAQFRWVQNITMGPRDLISSLGGWCDLSWYEDWDIWNRADRVQKYRWTWFRFARNVSLRRELSKTNSRLAQRYGRYRDMLRLGHRVFSDGEEVGLSRRLVYIVARLSLPFHGTLDGRNPEFNQLDPRLFVDFALGDRPAREKVA